MKCFKPTILTLGLGLSSFGAASSSPDYVKINDLSYGGSGCPQGSVGQTVNSDKTAFTLIFDEYFVEVGAGVSNQDRRKNCQVTVDLEFPQGWSYSVIGFDYRGYAYLDSKVKGTAKTKYYFQGETQETSYTSGLKGYMDDNYLISDNVEADALVWSPCGKSRALNVGTEIYLNNKKNKKGTGFLTVDTLDGEIKHIYHLQWKRCPTDPDDGGTDPGPGPGPIPGDGPSELTINSMSHGGTGCPQGTVGNLISDDRKAFTLIYDQFIAEVGPGVSLRERRKSCQLTIDFDYPEGWTYTLIDLDSRGFAYLEDPVSALQKTTYYFMGETNDIAFQTEFDGPFEENYHYTDSMLIDAIWAPCGERKPLNVKSEIRLSTTNRKAAGLMTVDSTDGSLSHRFGLRWKRCN